MRSGVQLESKSLPPWVLCGTLQETLHDNHYHHGLANNYNYLHHDHIHEQPQNACVYLSCSSIANMHRSFPGNATPAFSLRLKESIKQHFAQPSMRSLTQCRHTYEVHFLIWAPPKLLKFIWSSSLLPPPIPPDFNVVFYFFHACLEKRCRTIARTFNSRDRVVWERQHWN
jgi:hypothetical protein